MTFTSIPNNYTPLTEPIVCRFAFDEMREVVDVKIIDAINSKALGIKRLYNVQEAGIDLAPWLDKAFDCKFPAGGTSVCTAEGLFACIAVEVDGERSPERYFSPYPIIAGVGTIFRTAPKYYSLSRSERDMAVIYAPEGGTILCEAYCNGAIVEAQSFVIKPSDGVQIFCLAPSDFTESADEILVQTNLGGVEDYATCRIVPAGDMAHRLVWIDAGGVLQLYTFPTTRSSRLSVDKQRVLTADGLVVAATCAERSLTLVSDYETVAELERISEIIEARQVWLEQEHRGVKVDVISSESLLRYGGVLNSLQVEIRASDGKERLL